jgi:hypothetical protein
MAIAADAVAMEVTDDLLEISGCHAHAGIGSPIVKPDGMTIVLQDPTASEYHVSYVAATLVLSFRTEHPFAAAHYYKAGVIAVEQGQSQAIDRPGRRDAYAVIENEPSVIGE